MRTQVIVLLFLAFVGLLNAQTKKERIKIITLEDVIISSKNYTYLNKVQDHHESEYVQQLQNVVASYDITKSSIYDNAFDGYEVIFKESKIKQSKILATYNSEGKIVRTLERYKDVYIPSAVRNAVYKAYPDWTIYSDNYLISYYLNKECKKNYVIKIKNGNKKKTLKIDPNSVPKYAALY